MLMWPWLGTPKPLDIFFAGEMITERRQFLYLDCGAEQATALVIGRTRICPHVLDLGRMQQCLHHNTILFGFLFKCR